MLLQRDARGVVSDMHILDARVTTPMIGDDGSIWYSLSINNLSQTAEPVVVSANDIIHDRCPALHHPLIGVSPIFVCGSSASQGIKIQQNAATFFDNQSRPSGQLTAPGSISDETAQRLKGAFEAGFSGSNVGRLLVAGDGLRFEPMTIPAVDAQLVEQLRFTVEDVARCFHVPLFKLGGPLPPYASAAQAQQDYFDTCLGAAIESIEILLTEALNMPRDLAVELDTDSLLRLDLWRAQKPRRNLSARACGRRMRRGFARGAVSRELGSGRRRRFAVFAAAVF